MEPRVWYIHTARSFENVGVAGTQVVARVESLKQIADITLLSIERGPRGTARNSASIPGIGVESRRVLVSPPLFPYSLLWPGNAAVSQVLATIEGRPERRTEVLHCRSQWSTWIGLAVRDRLRMRGRRAVVVYDMEGVAAEEVTYLHRLRNRRPTGWTWLRYAGTRMLEAAGLRRADAVICVSDNMCRFIREQYAVRNERVRTVQGTADARFFHYDPSTCWAMRAALDVEPDQRLFVYNGSFAPYQQPEFFLSTFRQVIEKDKRAVLLMLTRHAEEAGSLLWQYGIPAANYRLTSVEYAKVGAYLNAADWGFCIRGNDVVNIAASPTKVAEYVCSGVPTVVSPWTGDYPGIVSQRNLGMVVDARSHSSPEVVERLLADSRVELMDRKQRCADYGRQHLTHRAVLPVYQELYSLLSAEQPCK